jgi:hypothetical protein
VQGSGSVSGSAWIRINFSCWIRIWIRIQIADPDPGGEKLPTKIEKSPEFSCFLSTGCSLLRAEGFSCILGVLYGGLGISKLHFLIKNIEIKFPDINFFNFRSSNPGSGSGIRNPDPQLEKMLDPDPYPDRVLCLHVGAEGVGDVPYLMMPEVFVSAGVLLRMHWVSWASM